MTIPGIQATAVGGTGPLLLLGPSLGTTTSLWDRAADELVGAFRVVSWDLPGHGRSPAADRPFSVSELADAVDILIDELGEADAFTAGDSLGGAVGLSLALRHPQRVRAHGSLCSAARFGTPEGWRERAALVRAKGTEALIDALAERWFAARSRERNEGGVVCRLLNAVHDVDDESYALCCEALADFDLRDELGSIVAPILVIAGDEDRAVPAADARELAARVPRGEFVSLPDVGHLAPVEAPVESAAALSGFFRTLLLE